MKLRTIAITVLVGCCLSMPSFAEEAHKAAGKAKAGAMDPKEMEEMMMKAAAPGPNHEMLKKLEGEWSCTVSWTMDPSQPPMTSQSKAVCKTIMDGRYLQEDDSGEMMGKPFSGMGITGYDNITKKFVGTWIDNAGTGIMTSEGHLDADGKVLTMHGTSSDPMTGKVSKYRMVTTFVDDNHHTFEMFGMMGKKEGKVMEIKYERKM